MELAVDGEANRQAAQARAPEPGGRGGAARSVSPTSSTASPWSCPADNDNASGWPAYRQPTRGVPDGRDPLEPRRQAPRQDPTRAGRTRPSGPHDIVDVTHDQVEAMTMADRIAIMTDGRLQQVGGQDGVRAPAQPVRGAVHRQPTHEHCHGTLARPGRGDRRSRVGRFPGIAHPARDGRPAPRWSSGCVPSTCDRRGSDRGDRRRSRVADHERHIVCDVAGEKVTMREPLSGRHGLSRNCRCG